MTPGIHCLFESSRSAAGDEAPAEIAFSVAICTDDRLDYLKRTLSALRLQSHGNFEVCVVAGPTDDGTRAYLEQLGADVKLALCSVRNLSRSRNIGIALSSGEIVAFIDDDAVPEPEWLAQLARSYDDDRVGAAGGVVHDHRGIDFQAKFVTVDRFGRPRDEPRPTPELNVPGAARFPHLLGTNCSFRRTALVECGGFDEQYEYFLDETDLCCRVNDAGHWIVQRPDAFVHHKYAPSALRDADKTVRSWYPLIKNRLYFGLRHARAALPVPEIVEAALAEREFWQRDVVEKARAGVLAQEDVQRFQREAETAIDDGMRFATGESRLINADLLATHSSTFRPFPRATPQGGVRVLLYLDADGGVDDPATEAMAAHARQMASEGHQVHFVTRRSGLANVDYDEGLWLYDLGTGANAASEVEEVSVDSAVERIASRRSIDAVYCLESASDSLQRLRPMLTGHCH